MEIDFNEIKVIGFDADDTLWVNETYFREAELEVVKLLVNFETPNKIEQEIYRMEMKNLWLYGYGVKAFILSMVEVAMEISNYTISNKTINDILNIGKEMLNKPVVLLPGVEEVLKALQGKYRLVVLTKGDLLDQERKLKKSNLSKYFHHIEVMSDKKEPDYKSVLNHLDVNPSEFLMIGNSLKSDVLPLLSLNSKAIHIPFHTTWEHEKVNEEDIENKSFITLNNIKELLDLANI